MNYKHLNLNILDYNCLSLLEVVIKCKMLLSLEEFILKVFLLSLMDKIKRVYKDY